MDFPQGFILDTVNDTLTWKKDTSTKPRLAVVMDYIWYLGGIRPFCHDIHSKEDSYIYNYNGIFSFQLSKEFESIFCKAHPHPFREIRLIAVGKGEPAILTMTPFYQFPYYYLSLNENGLEKFKSDVGKIRGVVAHFLSISFASIPGIIDADVYDLDSPWCFPVNIEGDYQKIIRPSSAIGGEVPDHNWYEETWEKEYGNKSEEEDDNKPK